MANQSARLLRAQRAPAPPLDLPLHLPSGGGGQMLAVSAPAVPTLAQSGNFSKAFTAKLNALLAEVPGGGVVSRPLPTRAVTVIRYSVIFCV